MLLTRYGHDVRQLALCDNLSVVLAFGRGRSRNYQILKILREFGAYLFARNVHVNIRWIPSELNMSDEGSREFEDCKDSKLLVDQLVDAWADETWPKSLRSSVFVASECKDAVQKDKDPQLPGGRQAKDLTRKEQPEEGPELGQRSHSSRYTIGKDARQAAWSKPFFGPADDREQSGGAFTAFAGCGAKEGSSDSQGSSGGGSKRERQYFVRARGRALRRQRAHLESQAKKAAQADSGCRDEQLCQSTGDSCGFGQGSGQLPEEVARSSHLHRYEQAPLPHRRGGGHGFGGVLQHALPRRGRQFSGGLHLGSAPGQAPRVWSPRIEEDSSSLAMPSRLAQAVPISLEACLSSGSLVRHQLAHGCPWARCEGAVQPPPGLDIPSSRYPPEASSDGIGTSYKRSHRALVSGHEPHGDCGCFENRDQGRFSAAGLGVASVCQPLAGGAYERIQTRQGVEVRLRRVPLCLSQLLSGPQSLACSIPGQTFGSKHRQSTEPENTGGGEEAWRLAESKECRAVREGGQACCDVAEARPGCTADVPCSGAILARDYARPKLSGYTSSWPLSRGRYFADFFSGSGRVGRAVSALGFKYRSWEVCHAGSEDLTNARVLMKIRFDIKQLRVLSAMLAPPSASFSPAMKIRSQQLPWGLQSLQAADEEKIRIDNGCLSAALQIISWMDEQRLPWIFEHPHSSLVWYTPEFCALQHASHTHVIVTDLCQWGATSRRRIRLLAGNLSEDDVARCDRQCCGCKGLCSRTNLRHAPLTGKHSFSHRTFESQHYPYRFCHALARALMAPHMLVLHDQL